MRSDGASRITCKGQPIFHFMGTSTFAEFAVLHAESVAKIPEAAPLDKVCLLGCGIATGWGAVFNTAMVHQGATAAVFGLGAVGLAVIEALVEAGASRIFAIDTNPDKFAAAKEWGATDCINPKVCACFLPATYLQSEHVYRQCVCRRLCTLQERVSSGCSDANGGTRLARRKDTWTYQGSVHFASETDLRRQHKEHRRDNESNHQEHSAHIFQGTSKQRRPVCSTQHRNTESLPEQQPKQTPQPPASRGVCVGSQSKRVRQQQEMD
jgi:hypothetical protein